MKDIKFENNLFKDNKQKNFEKKKVGEHVSVGLVESIKFRNRQLNDNTEKVTETGLIFNVIGLLTVFACLFVLLFYSVFELQVFEGDKMFARSEVNQIRVEDIRPKRGIIFDRNGEKLVKNVAITDLFLNLDPYLENRDIDFEKLEADLLLLEEILGPDVYDGSDSLFERIQVVLGEDPSTERIKLASDLENEKVLELKSLLDDIPGISFEDGLNRNYIYEEAFAHVLGYTGVVNEEEFENLDYVGFNDIVGRSGVEETYDKYLFGQKGQRAIEVNALGKEVSEEEYLLEEEVSGKNLYLSLDLDSQKKAYEILKNGVDEYDAESGSMIVQDVENGEILVMANFPSYDNNIFSGGISQEAFDELLGSGTNPLINRAIGSQMPPGSIFKTIVAASAYDAERVDKDTRYTSRRGYTLSGGTPFQEYQNNEYGSINIVDALMVSSNIYFCEVIRQWDMNELATYLEDFGIGQNTGIDLSGESGGMLPSPENKVELSKTTSPWLEPFWYPEADSCISVIGQGITTVTPIQAVNWVSAIANGGTLHTPHVGMELVDREGNVKSMDKGFLNKNFISDEALEVVREGMRASVDGERRVIYPLQDAKVDIAAKTGTAEFGKVSEDGEYEDTHAWVNGFFPYEDPKYSFVIFLEDGGKSNNAAHLAREFIDWFY